LQLAKNIKSEKELELHTNHYGFQTNPDYKDSNFYEYFCNRIEKNKNLPSYSSIKQALKVFKDFTGEEITFVEITESFCEKYLQYLQSKISYKGTLLAKATVNYYYQFFQPLFIKQ